MKDKEFTLVSKTTKELDGKLISGKSFERAAQSEDFQQALEFFRKYEDYGFEGAESILLADRFLMKALENSYATVYEIIPHHIVLDVLAVRYEFESLKTALFNYFSSSTAIPLYPNIGSINPDEYAAFFEHQDPFDTSLPDHLLKPAQLALNRIEQGESPSSALDQLPKNMFARMNQLAGMVENSFISDIVKSMIDFHNSLTLLKIKTNHHDPSTLESLLVENGRTSASFFATGITRSLDNAVPPAYHKQFSREIQTATEYFIKKDDFEIWNHLFRHMQVQQVKKADLIDYGPEVPFAYIIKKEDEINQIRTILYGKEKRSKERDIVTKLFV